MDKRKVPWKAEWRAAGLDPGPLTPEEEALVPTLEAENRAFLEQHPPEKHLAPGHRRPAGLKTPFPAWALPLAAAAAALVVLGLPVLAPEGASGPERIKGTGAPLLTVYRQGPSGAEKLGAGALVRPGDVLQAAYAVTGPVQGAVLSVDGDGNVTVHLAREGRSVALAPGGEHYLDFSYELDRAPRFEVFFLVTSARPFDLEPVRQTLKSTPWAQVGPGTLGAGLTVTVLPLTKAASR